MYIKKLSREKQYLAFLQMAGWYEERKVDVSDYQTEAYNRYIKLTTKALNFIEEFTGLEPYIQFTYKDAGDEIFYDFDFNLNVEEASKCYSTKDYHAISKFAKEKCLCLGTLGYYYPGVLAISETGRLYLKHDYNDFVKEFLSMTEIIASELKTCDDLTAIRVAK
ncbi:SUKH-3 domain-containing protein [Flavobacterium ginsengiterrae]|uniref:SUKH-3 immunity protein of toxin-antitoxin system n=1 Tax=Flavobacterium ginsengiterrae TaxID=871695 RepID=A0ABP7GKQ0_9FLAO